MGGGGGKRIRGKGATVVSAYEERSEPNADG